MAAGTVALGALMLATDAEADRTDTFRSSDIEVRGLSPAETPDGGLGILVEGRVRAQNGRAEVRGRHVVDISTWTVAERQCLVTVRNASRGSWATLEGL